MTGKEKCELLRSIRRKIAEDNNIEFLSADCNNEDDCAGTCPKCDAEIRFLEAELNRKAAQGESISISGIFDEIDESFLTVELDDDESSYVLAGDIQYIPDEDDEEDDEK